MNIHSLFQVYYNRKKLLPIMLVILLSFLVLAFITNMLWKNILRVTNDDFSLNYENIYSINIIWHDDLVNDSLLLERQKENLLRQIGKSAEVGSSTFSPTRLIDRRVVWGPTLTNKFGKHAEVKVGENFVETFELPLLSGKGFSKLDLLSAVPSVIIFKSLAEQENIKKVNDNSIIVFKVWSNTQREYIEKKCRVVGIVEDFPFLTYRDEFASCIFSFSPDDSRNSDNIYLKMARETPRGNVVSLFSQAAKNIGLQNSIKSLQIRSYDEIKSMKLSTFFNEVKIFFFIIILLITYVGATLFGVFYRYVLNHRDEFAIRRSFGCTQWDVYGKIMYEAVLYAMPGILLGVILFTNFGFLFDLKNMVISVVIPLLVILMVVVSSVIMPAISISRQPPVETLRDQ